MSLARAVMVALLALVPLIGCTEPTLPEADPTEPTADEPVTDVLDPVRDELVASIATMEATVVAARDHLVTASEADTAVASRRAAANAVALLLADGDRTAPGAPPPLFPAFTSDRGDAAPNDALTATLNLARDAGGTLGRTTVEALRDPIAGDVGAWERDAEGVVASARAAVTGPGGGAAAVEDRIASVLELPGDGTRALAWALLAAEAQDLDTAQAAAERGAAHLGVVLIGLSLLEETVSSTTDGTEG